MSEDSLSTPSRVELLETVNVLSDPGTMAAIAEADAQLRPSDSHLREAIDALTEAMYVEARAGHAAAAAKIAKKASELSYMRDQRPEFWQ